MIEQAAGQTMLPLEDGLSPVHPLDLMIYGILNTTEKMEEQILTFNVEIEFDVAGLNMCFKIVRLKV